MVTKRKLSFAFKVATTICCLAGIIINLFETNNILSMLSFYTIQSNILVLVFYIGYFIAKKINPEVEQTKKYYILKGAVTMAIFLTFIAYNIYLQPIGFDMDKNILPCNILKLSNILVHYVTPIMVVLDYFIFDKKGNLRKRYIPYWIIFPAIYPVYEAIYSGMGGQFFGSGNASKYAYFFLNVEKLGILGVLSYIVFIAFCFTLVCLVLIKIDNFFGKRGQKLISKIKKKKEDEKKAT